MAKVIDLHVGTLISIITVMSAVTSSISLLPPAGYCEEAETPIIRLVGWLAD